MLVMAMSQISLRETLRPRATISAVSGPYCSIFYLSSKYEYAHICVACHMCDHYWATIRPPYECTLMSVFIMCSVLLQTLVLRFSRLRVRTRSRPLHSATSPRPRGSRPRRRFEWGGRRWPKEIRSNGIWTVRADT